MMEREASQAVPALVKALDDPDSKIVREAVVKALRSIGPAAAEAVPALTRVLEDRDAELRSSAALALVAIGRWPAETVSAFLCWIETPASDPALIKIPFREAVNRRAEAIPIPILARALEHSDDRLGALRYLAFRGEEVRELEPLVEEASRSESRDERLWARIVLARSRPALRAELIPELLSRLVRKDGSVDDRAYRALCHLARESREVIPRLVEATLGEHTLADDSLSLLAICGLSEAERLPLVEALRGPDWPRRHHVLKAIAWWEPPALLALPTLAEEAGDGSTHALQIIERMRPEAREALPLLRNLLRWRSRDVRAWARRAIRAIERE